VDLSSTARIELQFLESVLFTDVCNPLPVLKFVTFLRFRPDDSTMKDLKKALSDNGIDFNQLKYWNSDRCLGFVAGL
jgi:hypothetical protein